MNRLSALYEVKDNVRVRIERKRNGKEYKYYLVKLPEIWIDKVARELGVSPEDVKLKLCFNEINSLMIVPLKPKNSPNPVTDPKVVAELEK